MCVLCCRLRSSANALDLLNAGATTMSCASVGGPMNVGSLPDLLNVNIKPPLHIPLDVSEPDSCTASLPSYEMAVAASNQRTQLLQSAAMMTSQPSVLTDSHARTHLLSGGNTIMLMPQVQYTLTTYCTVLSVY